ncbi:adenine deaminase [Arcticibacter tournemirensis]|uniref:Adenine deaminase n=1 Tax=Arcticibacter tournemirensis TaxID=699437 RepID=A0A4Q0MGP3_9SPHI|nr:adenine deaminase [Arcticibacter tournemirensis]RXF72159.1 adenine deaminase [Arcticibacter tournemirensis]
MEYFVRGNLVDVLDGKIYAATVHVLNGKIAAIEPSDHPAEHYILPGFIDAHVHIESSMLIPSEFARLAVVHGTVATVSDPHEIANVCGVDGVEFMIENGKTVPFKFCFGAPSCVPATVFETSGAILDADAIERLLMDGDIGYLTEVMNFPGVLNQDQDLMKKIALARRIGKPVDGHAPGLRGEALRKYVGAGISTDHECFTQEEALEKLGYGMKILIREGSAAKNFEALVCLIDQYSERVMFCSDDKHPDSLAAGHINQLCARAVAKGIDIFKVLRAACINPVEHYRLKVGLLKSGDPADFLIVKDLTNFEVLKTYIDGRLVAENGTTYIPRGKHTGDIINNFNCSKKTAADFTVPASAISVSRKEIPVIEARDGQLITGTLYMEPKIIDGNIQSDSERDLLKIAVVNRYLNAPVATAFIKNFGLKTGAIASSVAHDSHNIVAVGVDEASICSAVNLLINSKGGISLVNGKEEQLLALPVGGLMSDSDGYEVARKYSEMDAAAKALGSELASPYMTLSFMSLLVIPELKLSDKGLFDGLKFRHLYATVT